MPGHDAHRGHRPFLHRGIGEERGAILSIDLADLLHAATIALVGDSRRASVESVPFLPALDEIWLKLLEKRQTELAGEHAKNGPHAEDNPDSRRSVDGIGTAGAYDSAPDSHSSDGAALRTQSVYDRDPDQRAARTLPRSPPRATAGSIPPTAYLDTGGRLSASDGRPRGSSRARLPMLFDTEGRPPPPPRGCRRLGSGVPPSSHSRASTSRRSDLALATPCRAILVRPGVVIEWGPVSFQPSLSSSPWLAARRRKCDSQARRAK